MQDIGEGGGLGDAEDTGGPQQMAKGQWIFKTLNDENIFLKTGVYPSSEFPGYTEHWSYCDDGPTHVAGQFHCSSCGRDINTTVKLSSV